ncbi:MAG TPA: hypothetical protein DCY89_05325, partial [Gammaproteobacteria bacterium]|nr:hypothetical protein [Gammaproteobacteria bacterium]
TLATQNGFIELGGAELLARDSTALIVRNGTGGISQSAAGVIDPGTAGGRLQVTTSGGDASLLGLNRVERLAVAAGGGAFSLNDATPGLVIESLNAGRATLDTTGLVTQSGAIQAQGLELLGRADYQLTHGGNAVDRLAAALGDGGALHYRDGGPALNIGLVGATSGITTSTGAVRIEGGAIFLEDDIDAGAMLTIDGPLFVAASTVTLSGVGSGTAVSLSAVTVQPGTTLEVDGGPAVIDLLNLAAGGRISLARSTSLGEVVTNGGTLTAAEDLSLIGNGLLAGTDWTTLGALRFAAGSEVTVSGPLVSTLAGGLEQRGRLSVAGAGLEIRGQLDGHGHLHLDGGRITATGYTQHVGAELTGSGTIDLGSGAASLSGRVAPGGELAGERIGTIAVTGDVTFANDARVEMQVGLSSGDRIDVSGNVTLGGQLTATTETFTPIGGETYDLITATGTLVGDFLATSTLPAGATGSVVGGTWRLSFAAGACAGGFVCFDNDVGNFLWTDARNWSGDLLPGLSDFVLLNFATGGTITLNAGSHSVRGVSSLANNRLALTGGALTLTDTAVSSQLAGGLTVSSGSLTTASALTLSTLTLSGGTLTGSGDLSVSGNFTWSGGTLGGPGSLSTSGNSTVTTTSPTLARAWENRGTLNLPTGGNRLFLNPGGSLTNTTGATLNLTSTFGDTLTGSTGTSITNLGTLNSTGTQRISTTFHNQGNVNVSSGTLTLAGVITQSGQMRIAAGATLSTNDQGLVNTGTIEGLGRLDLDASGAVDRVLTNRGTLRAGLAAGETGRLVIDGRVMMESTSRVETEIAGLVQGVSFDVIEVTGQVSVGGALSATETGGFIVSTGQSFDIITAAGGMNGSFEPGSNLPPGVNGAIVGGSYRLSDTGLSCTGGYCWDGGAGTTQWTDAANWIGDALPSITDLVFINLVAGVNVTLSTGNHSIRALNTDAGNNLTITGGATLTLNDAGLSSTLNGSLTVNSGSSLTSAGNLSLNALNVTGGGTLNLAASRVATLNAASTLAGGILQGGTFSTAGGGTLTLTTNSDA